MLNISENSINKAISLKDFSSYKLLKKSRSNRILLFISLSILIVFLLSIFLPWTQNIQAKGQVTTRLPEQRPQAIQSVLSGRLEKWFVREGDYVNAGDTIVFLSEIKSEYFDPDLIARTTEQVEAKSKSITSYAEKVQALQNQYVAIQEVLSLKREQIENKILQADNKITIDSIDLKNYEINLDIAQNQLNRIKELYKKGLKTLSDVQEKELKVQEINAKKMAQQNKLANQKNERTNLKISLLSIEKEYADKLAKSKSDQQSAISAKLESVATTSKLQNQLSNYNERSQLYHITAPQSGYITKTLKKGIGEIIKEGVDIVTIMPEVYDLAIEIYLKPQDLPLLSIGNNVRLRFDGWPAIVISGWPESSTGVFDGKIVAIDQFISENGYYRTLVSPDKDSKAWPKELRVGTGAKAFILLKDVPIWYEMWRQLNGFPADFYKEKDSNKKLPKRKAPLKSVK